MAKFCSECRSPLVGKTSKFCDKWGAKTVETNTAKQKGSQNNPMVDWVLGY